MPISNTCHQPPNKYKKLQEYSQMVPILETIVSASALVLACAIWEIVSSYNKRKIERFGKIPFDWDYGVAPWYLTETAPIFVIDKEFYEEIHLEWDNNIPWIKSSFPTTK